MTLKYNTQKNENKTKNAEKNSLNIPAPKERPSVPPRPSDNSNKKQNIKYVEFL